MNRFFKFFGFFCFSLLSSNVFGMIEEIDPVHEQQEHSELIVTRESEILPSEGEQIINLGDIGRSDSHHEVTIDIRPDKQNPGAVKLTVKGSAKAIQQLMQKYYMQCAQIPAIMRTKSMSFGSGFMSALSGMRRGVGKIFGYTVKITIYCVAGLAAALILGEIFKLLVGYNIPYYAIHSLWSGLTQFFINGCSGTNAPQACVWLGRLGFGAPSLDVVNGVVVENRVVPVAKELLCTLNPDLVSDTFPLCEQAAQSLAANVSAAATEVVSSLPSLSSLLPSWLSFQTFSMPSWLPSWANATEPLVQNMTAPQILSISAPEVSNAVVNGIRGAQF